MAWTTPPVFTVGEDLTSTLMNILSADLAVLATNIGLYGAGPPVGGGTAPSGAPDFLVQCGLATLGFTSGSGTLPYPHNYPNNVQYFSAQVVDTTATNRNSVSLGTVGGGSAQIIFNQNSAAVTGSGIQFSWIAIGW